MTSKISYIQTWRKIRHQGLEINFRVLTRSYLSYHLIISISISKSTCQYHHANLREDFVLWGGRLGFFSDKNHGELSNSISIYFPLEESLLAEIFNRGLRYIYTGLVFFFFFVRVLPFSYNRENIWELLVFWSFMSWVIPLLAMYTLTKDWLINSSSSPPPAQGRISSHYLGDSAWCLSFQIFQFNYSVKSKFFPSSEQWLQFFCRFGCADFVLLDLDIFLVLS